MLGRDPDSARRIARQCRARRAADAAPRSASQTLFLLALPLLSFLLIDHLRLLAFLTLVLGDIGACLFIALWHCIFGIHWPVRHDDLLCVTGTVTSHSGDQLRPVCILRSMICEWGSLTQLSEPGVGRNQ
jgi:hypothetical protein